jgi:hypothetical protein
MILLYVQLFMSNRASSSSVLIYFNLSPVIGITTVYESLLEAAQEIPELHVSVSQSAKAAAITGTSTLVGSLLLGPAGILVGAAVGGVTAYSLSEPFKPALQVLKDMNELEREKLRDAVVAVAKEKGLKMLTVAAWERIPMDKLKDLLLCALKYSGYRIKMSK